MVGRLRIPRSVRAWRGLIFQLQESRERWLRMACAAGW